MRLVHNGRPGDSLEVDGKTYGAGEEFEVKDEERALELLTDPNINVTEAKADGGLKRLNKADLEQLASNEEIDISECSTKADLIDAIETARSDAQPAA